MKGTASTAEGQPAQAEKLYMENTLLRVSGALFCHDAKRAATHTEPIELNRGVAEKHIVIRPDPKLGQPGPLAHKIFVALIKKHSGYGRPIQSEVSFSKRELMRLVGRAHWGGRDSEELARALNEIHYAFIRTKFKAADKRFIEHSFNIFPEIYLERAEHEHDPIEACTVSLARPIVASLEDGHFTCLNHLLIRELGTIGQALYMRLFFHFANLYDGHHQKRLSFSKRYEDICIEWLGGLKVLRYRSEIERDQLGTHVRALLAADFLASYTIAPAARGGEGFVLTFRPGRTFFADYDRFYRRRERGSVHIDFDTDRENIAKPLRVAYLFVQKRTGHSGGIPYVPSKDVQNAKRLLEDIPFDEIAAFIDYGLAQAKKTRFDVHSLGGLRQYLPDYLQERDRLSRRRAAEAARASEDKATAERMAYSEYRRHMAQSIFTKLPAKEREAIEGIARANYPKNRRQGPLAELMLEIDIARITAERHGDRIASFQQWKTQKKAA